MGVAEEAGIRIASQYAPGGRREMSHGRGDGARDKRDHP